MDTEIRTDLPAKIKRERKHAVVREPQEAWQSPNGESPVPVKGQREKETSASSSVPLVEVEVLRIPPNPRLVICRYWVSGEERRCVVRVGRNSKFVLRMKFQVPEPSDRTTRDKPWPYAGPLPRRRGRW